MKPHPTSDCNMQVRGGFELCAIDVPGQKKRLVRKRKLTLRAAREASSDMKEGRHNEELMGKPRTETESVGFRKDESKERGREKIMAF